MLTFADNRALREKVWRAFVNRGDNGDANDTNAMIAQIVKLRADRARLLGFGSHADWRMQDTMAKTPAKAMELMMRVWPAAVARVREEVRDMQALADKSGAKLTIEPWDYRYYMEKVRKAALQPQPGRDQALFRAVEHDQRHVLDGRAALRPRVQGKYRHGAGLASGHPHLRGHRPPATGEVDRPVLHRQLCARPASARAPGRPPIAAASGLLGDKIVLASNNNNFTKPGPGEPVLISLDDAETLFHEFGHAIHSLAVEHLLSGPRRARRATSSNIRAR